MLRCFSAESFSVASNSALSGVSMADRAESMVREGSPGKRP
jgi:hypothetical protein